MSHDRDDVVREERAIYWIALAAAVPVVCGVLVGSGAFEAGSTISLGLCVLAIAGLVGLWRRRARLPRAQVRVARGNRVSRSCSPH